jgi:UDP-glucose 4-epimerase
MKCLVTGGAGFIGSHLVDRLLQDGHDVLVIDNFSTGRRQNLSQHSGNPRLAIVDADVADSAKIDPHFSGRQAVFHLAGLADIVPSIVEPAAYYRANVAGTFAVAEACRRHGVAKLVYAASSSCYGIPQVFPTPETAPANPQYPYALTKYLGEQVVMHWAKVYKIPAVSLRLFNVYGPRSRTSGAYGAVFGVFLAQKIAGRPFTVVGDGAQTRDFTFVSDVAAAFVAAADSCVSGEIFNVGSGNTYSVNQLVELLGGEVTYIPKRPGEPDATHADISKIKRLLGWQPEVSFREGVKILLDNIDYWRDAPLWTPEAISEATKEWFSCLSRKP